MRPIKLLIRNHSNGKGHHMNAIKTEGVCEDRNPLEIFHNTILHLPFPGGPYILYCQT